jgi:hypothetical protein
MPGKGFLGRSASLLCRWRVRRAGPLGHWVRAIDYIVGGSSQVSCQIAKRVRGGRLILGGRWIARNNMRCALGLRLRQFNSARYRDGPDQSTQRRASNTIGIAHIASFPHCEAQGRVERPAHGCASSLRNPGDGMGAIRCRNATNCDGSVYRSGL